MYNRLINRCRDACETLLQIFEDFALWLVDD